MLTEALLQIFPVVTLSQDLFDRPAVYTLKQPWLFERQEGGDYLAPNGATAFWRDFSVSYRYLPSSSSLVECARSRWQNGTSLGSNSDCMVELMKKRYNAYWTEVSPDDYDSCCQPAKAEVCGEPPLFEDLPLCGFPFGSVDYLPAFLPELILSLPSGPLRLLQGIFDEDLICTSSTNCRLRPFHFQRLESILLWSTSMATYLDLQPDLIGRKALDLGSGIGLTCVVLARRGVDVTCTDIDEVALSVAAKNARSLYAAGPGGSIKIAWFNYSTASETWRRQGVVPPFDLIVLGATSQGELAKRLPEFARLFRQLGRLGTRIFIEDQGHVLSERAAPDDNHALAAFRREGLDMVDAFDPCTRGLWPMPRGRIYALRLLSVE
eukprot:TRINITY_DN17968_c1_g2_i1.p1 TRINITY_DN17968_c1_g2~~TRINITY_DN17968_c1_g2_i1.p1  ORF type:complete len:380 (-),score=61.87 TRINITY_DN17968_c1_g2_i1:155-1294(-)